MTILPHLLTRITLEHVRAVGLTGNMLNKMGIKVQKFTTRKPHSPSSFFLVSQKESLSTGGFCSTWWNCGWNTDEKMFLPRRHQPAVLVIVGSVQMSNWMGLFPKWPSCCTWTRHLRPFILRQPTLTCSMVSSGHFPLLAAGSWVQHTSAFEYIFCCLNKIELYQYQIKKWISTFFGLYLKSLT